jgi:hypothetical protein
MLLGVLTYSQRSSVLVLLFKKGDPLLLDNLKLISLLNVHLKILSHVLAQRLKKILSKLINENQIMLKTDLKGLIYDKYRI